MGTPAASKESPGSFPAFRGWALAVVVLWTSSGRCQEQWVFSADFMSCHLYRHQQLSTSSPKWGPEACPYAQVEASQVAGNSRKLPQPQRCWPWSQWKRPWLCSSPLEVSIRSMSDWEPGEGWWSTNTFGRLRSSVGSITPESVPPVSSTHPLYQPVGSSPPPQEAISCQRQHPACEWPIGSNCSPAGQLS